MTRVPDRRALPVFVFDDRGRAIHFAMTQVTGAFDWQAAMAIRWPDVPTVMLPYAIRSLGVQDYVEPGMREVYQRRVVENAIPIKIQEGTIKGVRFALSLLGMTVEWTQWHRRQPLGMPGTHRAVVRLEERLFEGEPLLSERSLLHAKRVIETVKRHSQDVDFMVAADTAAKARVAAVGVRPMHFGFLEGVAE
ncbi:phage tail protein I [Methylocystis sp. S23]